MNQNVNKTKRARSASFYGGSEVTCGKPDTFLLVATFAASFTASLILLRVEICCDFCCEFNFAATFAASLNLLQVLLRV